MPRFRVEDRQSCLSSISFVAAFDPLAPYPFIIFYALAETSSNWILRDVFALLTQIF